MIVVVFEGFGKDQILSGPFKGSVRDLTPTSYSVSSGEPTQGGYYILNRHGHYVRLPTRGGTWGEVG